MALNIRLNMAVGQIIKSSGINDNTALFAANEAKRLMNDYVPMKTGVLCNTAQVFVESGRGVVFYNQPYAGFCYYGDRKNFNRDKHEKATAYWDKAMLLTHRDALSRRVSYFIKKR